MDPKHLNELIAVERTYWWHLAKRELVCGQLVRHLPPPGRLVEGGVGAGGNLLAFRDLGYEVTGFDCMPESVAHCRESGLPDVHVHELEMRWPVGAATLRAVVLLDVLEHLDQPVAALRHAADALQPDGGIIASVPAGPWLMGPWDRMLGHRRRYTMRALRQQAAQAGLRSVWMSYWNAFTLPAAIVVRTYERISRRPRSAEFPPVRPIVNQLLVGCARLERLWMRIGPVPCGLSLIGVFRR